MAVLALDAAVLVLDHKLGAFTSCLNPSTVHGVGLAIEDSRRSLCSVLLDGPAPVRARLNGNLWATGIPCAHHDLVPTQVRPGYAVRPFWVDGAADGRSGIGNFMLIDRDTIVELIEDWLGGDKARLVPRSATPPVRAALGVSTVTRLWRRGDRRGTAAAVAGPALTASHALA